MDGMKYLSTGVVRMQSKNLDNNFRRVILHERATVVRFAQRQYSNARARNLVEDWLLGMCRHGCEDERYSSETNNLVLHLIVTSNRLQHLQRVDYMQIFAHNLSMF